MVKIKRANRKTEYIYANKQELLKRKKSDKIIIQAHPEVHAPVGNPASDPGDEFRGNQRVQ